MSCDKMLKSLAITFRSKKNFKINYLISLFLSICKRKDVILSREIYYTAFMEAKSK